MQLGRVPGRIGAGRVGNAPTYASVRTAERSSARDIWPGGDAPASYARLQRGLTRARRRMDGRGKQERRPRQPPASRCIVCPPQHCEPPSAKITALICTANAPVVSWPLDTAIPRPGLLDTTSVFHFAPHLRAVLGLAASSTFTCRFRASRLSPAPACDWRDPWLLSSANNTGASHRGCRPWCSPGFIPKALPPPSQPPTPCSCAVSGARAPVRKNCCSPALQATTSDSDANNLESWCLQIRWEPTCKRAKSQTYAESCCHPVS